MGLSFLDMLSCALGGMILLFMIFASMEHRGERRERSVGTVNDNDRILNLPAEQPVAGDDRSPWIYRVHNAEQVQAPDEREDVRVLESDDGFLIVLYGAERISTTLSFVAKSGKLMNCVLERGPTELKKPHDIRGSGAPTPVRFVNGVPVS